MYVYSNSWPWILSWIKLSNEQVLVNKNRRSFKCAVLTWDQLCSWLSGLVCMFSLCLCRFPLGSPISSYNPNTYRSSQVWTVNFPQVWIDLVYSRLSPNACWGRAPWNAIPVHWWSETEKICFGFVDSLTSKWSTKMTPTLRGIGA